MAVSRQSTHSRRRVSAGAMETAWRHGMSGARSTLSVAKPPPSSSDRPSSQHVTPVSHGRKSGRSSTLGRSWRSQRVFDTVPTQYSMSLPSRMRMMSLPANVTGRPWSAPRPAHLGRDEVAFGERLDNQFKSQVRQHAACLVDHGEQAGLFRRPRCRASGRRIPRRSAHRQPGSPHATVPKPAAVTCLNDPHRPL